MRRKGISLLIPVLFLLMLLLIGCAIFPRITDFSQIRFLDNRHGGQLVPYYDEEEELYYLFLPSYLPPEDVTADIPWYLTVTAAAGDQIYSDLRQVPMGRPLSCTLSSPWGQQETYSLQVMACSARRTIHMSASEGTLSYLYEDKERKRQVSVSFLDPLGEPEYQGLATLSGRGNATWKWPKKPFNLDFSEKITVGPFQNYDKLCLFAEYADDSKLRNSLGFRLGELLGIPYVSPYIYTDVFVNGEYYGLCALATKEEYTRYIEKDGIQAVFELSSSTRGVQFTTDMQQQVRVHYGSSVDVEYIVECFEQALGSQNWEQVCKMIDLDSWALKYAMEEFLFNTDLGWASQYFYVGPDGMIHAMLPWDYEWTLENIHSGFAPGAIQDLAVNRVPGCWYHHLIRSQTFSEAVHRQAEENLTPELFASLTQHMEHNLQEISGSWYCDRLRWQNTFVGNQSYISEPSWLWECYDYFTAFWPNRRTFLLEYFSHPEDYRTIYMKYMIGGNPRSAHFQYVLPTGTSFADWEEPIYASTQYYLAGDFRGWFTEDGTPLENLGVVTDDLTLYGHFDGPPLQ